MVKTICILMLGLFACKSVKERTEMAGPARASIYDYPVTLTDGSPLNLKDLKGKKILIVNVASKCGYTPQYKDLQELYDRYKNKLVVIGFPSNDFLGQEPGTNQEIQTFCTKNYGVSFPIAEKISVKGEKKAEIYKWLSEKDLNGWNDKEPGWNFCKYLIDEDGRLIAFYSSSVNPLDKDILKHLQ